MQYVQISTPKFPNVERDPGQVPLVNASSVQSRQKHPFARAADSWPFEKLCLADELPVPSGMLPVELIDGDVAFNSSFSFSSVRIFRCNAMIWSVRSSFDCSIRSISRSICDNFAEISLIVSSFRNRNARWAALF